MSSFGRQVANCSAGLSVLWRRTTTSTTGNVSFVPLPFRVLTLPIYFRFTMFDICSCKRFNSFHCFCEVIFFTAMTKERLIACNLVLVF